MVSFLHTMEQINRQNEVRITLADFNVIEGNHRISIVLSNYTQSVRETTYFQLIDRPCSKWVS